MSSVPPTTTPGNTSLYAVTFHARLLFSLLFCLFDNFTILLFGSNYLFIFWDPAIGWREQMAPPSYSDLGKQARDIFGKGYHFGLWKLDVKTKTSSGVEFSTGGHSNQDNGKVFGSLETKYRVKEYGLTFNEKWNTDNTLTTEVSIQDKILEGLKLSLDCSFAPQSGYDSHSTTHKSNNSHRGKKYLPRFRIRAFYRPIDKGKLFVSFCSNKNGRVKAEYCHDYVHFNSDVNCDLAGPLVNASAVFGYQGWLAGYQVAFDSQKSKITGNNFALGFTANDFVLHTSV